MCLNTKMKNLLLLTYLTTIEYNLEQLQVNAAWKLSEVNFPKVSNDKKRQPG